MLDEINPSPDAQAQADPSQDSTKRGDRGSGVASGAGRGAASQAAKPVEIGGGRRCAVRGGLLLGGGSLLGAPAGPIQPCPVVLEVVLNDKGMIAKPPTILRPEGALLDETRLIAEERAIRALAGCVPYKGAVPKGGQQAFHLDFATSR